MASGQRLQVESRGEQLKISFFESDGRLLLGHSADAVRTEETVCTLSVPGRIRRDFFGHLEVKSRDGLLLPRITVKEESAVQQILQSEMADVQQSGSLKVSSGVGALDISEPPKDGTGKMVMISATRRTASSSLSSSQWPTDSARPQTTQRDSF